MKIFQHVQWFIASLKLNESYFIELIELSTKREREIEDTLIRIVYKVSRGNFTFYIFKELDLAPSYTANCFEFQGCVWTIRSAYFNFKNVNINVKRRSARNGGREENGNDRIIFIINKTREYAYTRKEEAGAQLIQFYTTTLPIHGKPATVSSPSLTGSLHLKTNQNLIYISFSPRYKNSATITSFVPPSMIAGRGDPCGLESHGEPP